jgi:hypothetical protein
MTTATRATRATKLDRLLEQGQWVVTDVDGLNIPYFAMPTPELQGELNEALNKKIKKHLKADGFELLHATRRDHPFYTAVLRDRIDDLASVVADFNKEYATDESIEATRLDLYGLIEDTKNYRVPFTEHDIEQMVEKGVKEARIAWASAVSKVRDYLRDPKWWKGTYLDRILNPAGGPPLPAKPLPKPVYVSKQSEIVLSLEDGFVNLYARTTA